MSNSFKYSIKLLLLGTGILIFNSCGNSSQTKTEELSETPVVNEIQIDSSEVFIQDSLIYSVMEIFLDSLGGGYDSNIIISTPYIQPISEIPFEFIPRNPKDQYFELFTGNSRDGAFGFGIKHFEGDTDDSIYIEQQIKSNTGKRWLASNFKGIEYDSTMLIKYEREDLFDWEAFKKDGFGCFETYGLPIFDKNEERCLIHIGFSCHGTIGGGSTYLLEKKGGIWYIVGKKQGWMS